MHLYTKISRLISKLPWESAPVTVNFDVVCETREDSAEVELKIKKNGGIVLGREQFGPGGGWPSWTVKFFSRARAAACLTELGLLKKGWTLETFEVKA